MSPAGRFVLPFVDEQLKSVAVQMVAKRAGSDPDGADGRSHDGSPGKRLKRVADAWEPGAAALSFPAPGEAGLENALAHSAGVEALAWDFLENLRLAVSTERTAVRENLRQKYGQIKASRPISSAAGRRRPKQELAEHRAAAEKQHRAMDERAASRIRQFAVVHDARPPLVELPAGRSSRSSEPSFDAAMTAALATGWEAIWAEKRQSLDAFGEKCRSMSFSQSEIDEMTDMRRAYLENLAWNAMFQKISSVREETAADFDRQAAEFGEFAGGLHETGFSSWTAYLQAGLDPAYARLIEGSEAPDDERGAQEGNADDDGWSQYIDWDGAANELVAPNPDQEPDARETTSPPRGILDVLPYELRLAVLEEIMRSDPDANATLRKFSLESEPQKALVADAIRRVRAEFRPPLNDALAMESRHAARKGLEAMRSRYPSDFIQGLVESLQAIREKTEALSRHPHLDDRLEAAEADLRAELRAIEDDVPPTTATEQLRREHGIMDPQAYDEMLVRVWRDLQEDRSDGAEWGDYRLFEETAIRRLFDSAGIKNLEEAARNEFEPLETILKTGSRSEARANAAAFIAERASAAGPPSVIPPSLQAKYWALQQYGWLENRLDAAKVHVLETMGPASEAGHLHGVEGSPEFARAVEEAFDAYLQDAKEYLRTEMGREAGRELNSADIQYIGSRFDVPSIRPRIEEMNSKADVSSETISALLERDLLENAWATHSGDSREMPTPFRAFPILLEHERAERERSEVGDGDQCARDRRLDRPRPRSFSR